MRAELHLSVEITEVPFNINNHMYIIMYKFLLILNGTNSLHAAATQTGQG